MLTNLIRNGIQAFIIKYKQKKPDLIRNGIQTFIIKYKQAKTDSIRNGIQQVSFCLFIFYNKCCIPFLISQFFGVYILQ
jgi:hypothetical protein